MINIDRVNREGHIYFPLYRYRFPSIDFKFQNTGNATALLWSFIISILSTEIDPTPVFDFLDFEVGIEDNALEITVTNNGWGTAYDCYFRLDEPTLKLLFTDADLQYRGTIKSGERQKIFHLTYEHIDPGQLGIIKERSTTITYFPIDPKTQLSSQETVYGIRFSHFKTYWRCRDEKDALHEKEVYAHDWSWDFVLTSGGFCKIRAPKSGAGFPSEVTFSSIIDPTSGAYEQSYPISRKIPPGDIERFHILIGSPISCHLFVKFKFLVDETQVIESGVFDIEIWNPRNSEWHYVYKDGKELRRDLEKQQNQASASDLNTSEMEGFKRLEQKALVYPFIDE